MENLWTKAHKFILDSKVGDFYLSGGDKVSVIKRTPKKIHFSNGNIVTITKSKFGFFYLTGKKIDTILRDIEGHFLYLIHTEDGKRYITF